MNNAGERERSLLNQGTSQHFSCLKFVQEVRDDTLLQGTPEDPELAGRTCRRGLLL